MSTCEIIMLTVICNFSQDACKIISHVNIIMLHVNIIMLLVDINKAHNSACM